MLKAKFYCCLLFENEIEKLRTETLQAQQQLRRDRYQLRNPITLLQLLPTVLLKPVLCIHEAACLVALMNLKAGVKHSLKLRLT
jgi:hypothetical protein